MAGQIPPTVTRIVSLEATLARFLVLIFAVLCVSAKVEARELLSSANTYFFVATTGNDANDCRSVSTKCATVQRAIEVLYSQIDAGCRKVTVSVADGEYLGFEVRGPLPGLCAIEDFQIVGNVSSFLPQANWSTVTITSPILASGGARFYLRGMRLTTATSSALFADDFGTMIYGGLLDFGPASYAQRRVRPGARIRMMEDYTISGSAVAHANGSGHSQQQDMPGITVTFVTSISSRVTFGYFALATEFALMNFAAGTGGTRYQNQQGFPCGTSVPCANGKRFSANFISQIVTGGSPNAFLPGAEDGEIHNSSLAN